MNKLWNIMKRLGIVLYFFITIPCLLFVVYYKNIDYLEINAYYYSPNKVTEFAGLIRLGGKVIEKEQGVTLSIHEMEDKELVQSFIKSNREDAYLWKSFLKGESSSRYIANTIMGAQAQNNIPEEHYGIYVLYVIIIDLFIVLGYVVCTDLLLKTVSYIANGKFQGGLDYKKMLISLKKRVGKCTKN